MSLDRIVGAVDAALRRARKGAVVGCVMATLAVTAFGFATAALYLALAEAMQPVFACLVIAGACLVVALLVLLLARSGGDGRARRPPPEPPRGDTDAVSYLIATFLAGVRAGREGFRRDRH